MAEETVSPDIELVKDSLEFYDKNQEIYKKKLDNITYIRFKEASTEIEHNMLYLYNDNKENLNNYYIILTRAKINNCFFILLSPLFEYHLT